VKRFFKSLYSTLAKDLQKEMKLRMFKQASSKEQKMAALKEQTVTQSYEPPMIMHSEKKSIFYICREESSQKYIDVSHLN
jgi:hypothetical protein